MKNNKKAFTLIELLVVVLIIGILVAVALPQYQKAVMKSSTAQGIIKLRAMTQAQKVYWMENGKFARDKEALAISHISSCHDSSGMVVYCSIQTNTPDITFEWYGIDATGNYIWQCLAKTTNALANQICQQYQAEWKGSSTVESNNGFTYYKGQLLK